MTVLIAGASGATGRLLVGQLLERGHHVRAVVRSPDGLPASLRQHGNLTVIRAGILELGDAELARHVDGCRAIASCLGHNLTWKGIYGPPRRLVTDAVRRLCDAARAARPAAPTRFVLMNTSGNRNRDLDERIPAGEKVVMGLIRALVPPHADNEKAADHLRAAIGPRDPAIEWVAVRPDTLTNEQTVSAYDVHPSPIRSALFNPGKTSRINVAHFMAELATDDETWALWKGRMPVIYNRPGSRPGQ